MSPKISVSIVVHRQASLAFDLLRDLDRLQDPKFRILLTFNVPETIPFGENDFSFPVTFIRNSKPKGFGANHNAAFKRMKGHYFCIANPDIRLPTNPFSMLVQLLEAQNVAVAAPFIITARGIIEDSVRPYPAPVDILAKAMGIKAGNAYAHKTAPFNAEWVAGMFMLFEPGIYKAIGGFDENYHLYYEDVDICARLKLAGYKIMACPSVSVIHNARRESHRNLRYMRWHLQSMLRFFLSRTFRQVRSLKSS